MTNKRNRFYQIGFFIITFAFITLCAYMGITAVQKSMRLNVGFSAKPNVVCCIGVKKTLETANYTPIFDNKANQIAGGVRLSGNSLIFDDTRFSNSVLGGEYYLSFTNYSDTGSAVMLSFSNANVNDVQPYQYIVTSGGTVDGLAITHANSMTINMQKCVEVTLNTTGVELNTTYANTIISQDGHYYQNASEDLNIKLKSSSGYAEPPKIDSIQINGSSYEANLDGNNILTIPANAINGDITINTSAVELLGVSLSGLSNCTSSNANTQIATNSTYSTTITPNTNYSLPETITVKQGGVTLNTNQYSWDSTTGQLSIPSVTGNIEITCVAVMRYNITYVMNDVDSPVTAPTNTTYVKGDPPSYSALPNKTNGAEFLGWTYTGDNVTPLETPTKNITLPNTTTGDLEITANWGATLLDGTTVFKKIWNEFKTSGPAFTFNNSMNTNNGIMTYAGAGNYYSSLQSITYDYWSSKYASGDYLFDYNNDGKVAYNTDGIALDDGGKGSIMLFTEANNAYILSPNKIFGNLDCQNLFTAKYMTNFDYYHNLSSITLSNFDTSNVTNMRDMFSYCYSLTSLDLSNFNTSNVTSMRSMFRDCYSLTSLDLSSFNTGKVTDMYYMFEYCSSLETIYVGNSWLTANVSNSSSMFSGCTSLVGGNGTSYNSIKASDSTNYNTALYARIDKTGTPGYFTSK